MFLPFFVHTRPKSRHAACFRTVARRRSRRDGFTGPAVARKHVAARPFVIRKARAGTGGREERVSAGHNAFWSRYATRYSHSNFTGVSSVFTCARPTSRGLAVLTADSAHARRARANRLYNLAYYVEGARRRNCCTMGRPRPTVSRGAFLRNSAEKNAREVEKQKGRFFAYFIVTVSSRDMCAPVGTDDPKQVLT